MNFNFEKWLSHNSYWEDPDSVIIAQSTEDGGVSLASFDRDIEVEGATLEEACSKYEEENVPDE